MVCTGNIVGGFGVVGLVVGIVLFGIDSLGLYSDNKGMFKKENKPNSVSNAGFAGGVLIFIGLAMALAGFVFMKCPNEENFTNEDKENKKKKKNNKRK